MLQTHCSSNRTSFVLSRAFAITAPLIRTLLSADTAMGRLPHHLLACLNTICVPEWASLTTLEHTAVSYKPPLQVQTILQHTVLYSFVSHSSLESCMRGLVKGLVCKGAWHQAWPSGPTWWKEKTWLPQVDLWPLQVGTYGTQTNKCKKMYSKKISLRQGSVKRD